MVDRALRAHAEIANVAANAAAGRGLCEPMYFVDGSAVDRAFPENALADVERALTTTSIRGIEVYSSEAAEAG